MRVTSSQECTVIDGKRRPCCGLGIQSEIGNPLCQDSSVTEREMLAMDAALHGCQRSLQTVTAGELGKGLEGFLRVGQSC